MKLLLYPVLLVFATSGTAAMQAVYSTAFSTFQPLIACVLARLYTTLKSAIANQKVTDRNLYNYVDRQV